MKALTKTSDVVSKNPDVAAAISDSSGDGPEGPFDELEEDEFPFALLEEE